jgi:hypothetical protein
MRYSWCFIGLLTACFAPTYPEGIPCSERDTCPPGMLCDGRDHVCRRELMPGCTRDDECESGICDTTTGTCAPASCSDGVQNGAETDIDCGGSACAACANGGRCQRASDCQSGACNQSTCAPESCGDGAVQAGEECDGAGASATCDADCTHPACGDGVVNAVAGEACDTADGPCCSDTCTSLAAGEVCRPAAAACDRAELCDGAMVTCPADALEPQGTLCRAAVSDCDAAEQCDGASVACPDDGDAGDGATCDDCEAGSGLCDRCTGGVCTNLCGNGVIDDAGGEQCDGSEDATCPGHCSQSCACAFPPTCLAYRNARPDLPDGRYIIDPDGASGLAPFEVPCDMTTDGGGWTVIEYASDLPFRQQHSGGDIRRYLPQDFDLVLSGAQIAAIQARATEGFQRYVGLCSGVIHYFLQAGASYEFSFGFRFLDGTETPSGLQSYAPFDVTVAQDGCIANGGEGGALDRAAIFDIRSPRVPVANVSSRDSGDSGELFGSPLTQNPARLR